MTVVSTSPGAPSELSDTAGEAFVAEQIAAAEPTAGQDRRRRRSATMRPILWRLHFIGGFLAGPVIVSLCLTGILYAWHPQIDDLRFGSVMHPSSDDVEVSMADQVRAAQASHPDWGLHSVTPGHDGLNTAVLMDPPGGEPGFGGPTDGVDVYVDQATGEVTGEVVKTNDTNSITRDLHSSWRLGADLEPLTELAGAWFIATLLTGVYLWWPGLRRRGLVAFSLRRRLGGRRQAKEWHTFIGLTLFVPMFFLAVTGLTWTRFSGDRVDLVRDDVLRVERDGVDAALPTPSPGISELANIDQVLDQAREVGLVEPIEIVVPRDDSTAWQVSSQDSLFPLERDQIVVGADGQIRQYADYSDQHWFNKLRTAAILFHQAQLFGLPLQIFMTVLALGIGALVIFGYLMWWQRRPAGGMGSPPSIANWFRNAPLGVIAAVGVLGWLMPTLLLSVLIWLVIERGWNWFNALRSPRAGDVPRPDLVKALAITALGTAMTIRPVDGDGSELPTMTRLAAWAWGRPLGLVFVAVGILGLAALTRGRQNSTDGELDQVAVG